MRVICVKQQQQPTLGFVLTQSLMNQLLNKHVLIGVPSLKERLGKMDQRNSDDPSEDSKLHSHLSLPLSLCLSTIRLWHGAQSPQGQVLL